MTNRTTDLRVTRAPNLAWVPIAKMKVSPVAQREHRQSFVDQLAADFDPERLGYPVLNHRTDDGHYYIIDGQHRILALKTIGWGDQFVQCEVYEGLDERGEADVFLWRNKKLAVHPFDRFRIAITAGRHDECDIDRIVREAGMRLDGRNDQGSLRAVGALQKVYDFGPEVLARTLAILNTAYDGRGIDGHIIHGVGAVCQRYNGQLDDDKLTGRLGSMKNGADGLSQRAYSLRKQSGRPVWECVAAAAVDTVNAGKGGKKLPSWWS